MSSFKESLTAPAIPIQEKGFQKGCPSPRFFSLTSPNTGISPQKFLTPLKYQSHNPYKLQIIEVESIPLLKNVFLVKSLTIEILLTSVMKILVFRNFGHTKFAV